MPEESHAPDADPYVCFRKRETKSLRKPRRGDALAHDKLLRLRDDLTRATAILDQIHARDTARLELVQIDRQIFEQRTSIRRKRAALGLAAHDIDASPERPRKPRRVHRDDRYLN